MWLASSDPYEMFRDLLYTTATPPSQRKCRLYAVACCRLVWNHMPDPRSRRAVLTAERFADGRATASELRSARMDAPTTVNVGGGYSNDLSLVACHALRCCDEDAASAAEYCAQPVHLATAEALAGLLREVFGDPHEHLAALPGAALAHDGRLPVRLAEGAYDRHDFSALPVLGDVLEEAGVAPHTPLLEHLRSRGPHCRGCWALDLIMWKG